jgi:hypothetical protein
MPGLVLTPNLELDPWTDLQPATDHLPHNPNGACAVIERMGLLPNATEQQRACVELLIRLPDGSLLVAETTWRLFATAAHALMHTPVAQLEEA